ncbi:ATP-binding protein [Phenylobacterium sp.]|uniref:hybrid sensor histidine kinase/response regulator n=1 Tax=Phenylobacterium sp. TaxID=1871053 RepID=UPI0025F0FFA8|nr:ATP-binding protein [Phenylobacterium sp.]
MVPPSDDRSEGQAALRRLIGLGATLVALVVVGAVTLLAGGSQALDDLQVRQDRARVESAIERSRQRLVSDLTTVTVWDQAYRELKPGGSLKWADDEVGSYFANNRGRDWTIVVDGRDRPFYAWVGADRADPAGQGRYLEAARALIAQARAVERQRGAKAPAVAPTNPSLAETAAGVLRIDGTYYIVAASTVTPENAATRRAPGPSVLIVSAERMDGELTGTLRQFGLKDVRLAPAVPGPAAVVLRDPTGKIIGELAWTLQRPGLKVLAEAAPVLACVLLALGAVMAALGWQIARVVRRLSAHERALTEAMGELAEARDRAEAANVAKSRFLANMSHEIRTPLNGVLGMAQVLARSDLKPADREKVGVIQKSGEGLLSLLNDILDLSKVEAGRIELDAQPFDLDALVDGATRGFAMLAAQKGVDMHVEIEPAARGVWMGDGSRVRQVLANLTSNAVKFTSEGEVRVRVRRTGDGLEFTVADTGLGIAPELLPRLFHPFTQVDATTTRRFGGTGLGLAIARELVELMHGRITVSSEAGRGSAFAFSLALEWLRAADATEDQGVLDDLAQPGLRILAAEDNSTNQLLLAAMLEPLGVDLTLAADGREAVDAFAAGHFDLVLMDVQMPTMNGIDAGREIRAIEARRGGPRTPILAVSANVMDHQVKDYLAAGMDGFVAKPIELAALLSSIEAVLEPEPGREACALADA